MSLDAKQVYIRRIEKIIKNVDEGVCSYQRAFKDLKHARDSYVENLKRLDDRIG